jgi:glucose-6-phosphate 1-epimerase
MSTIDLVEYGQLPALRIRADDGAEAIVTLYGAHLVSWIGADGASACSAASCRRWTAARAIRGGVPVIFPQFAERGDGMRHGFARISTWRMGANAGRAADGGAHASFVLDAGDLAAPIAQAWPHKFALRLTWRCAPTNCAHARRAQPRQQGVCLFRALHSYLAVDDLGKVRSTA